MFQRILVPLDGLARAEQAIPVAIRLARASGGTLVFLHVVFPSPTVGVIGMEGELMAVQPGAYEKHMAEAGQYLQQIRRKYAVELAGIRVEQKAESGVAAVTIFSIARRERIDLIVLRSHGAHSLFHWIFRSIARDAVHYSPVPVLVLKESESLFLASHQGRPLHMLVPLDGSALAETALQPALALLTALAAPEQGVLHLVQVIDRPSIEGKSFLRASVIKHEQEHATMEAEAYLQGITERLKQTLPKETQLIVTWSTPVSNHVAHTLIKMTSTLKENEPEYTCDLVAMATHGRTGFQRLHLGSVTEQVLGAIDLPLLVVHPPRKEEAMSTPERRIKEEAH